MVSSAARAVMCQWPTSWLKVQKTPGPEARGSELSYDDSEVSVHPVELVDQLRGEGLHRRLEVDAADGSAGADRGGIRDGHIIVARQTVLLSRQNRLGVFAASLAAA